MTSDDDGRGVIGEGYTGGRFGTAWETACAKGSLPGEWAAWVDVRGQEHRRFDPLHTPYSIRHTFVTWHRCVHQDLRAEVGWTTTRMGQRYGEVMSGVYDTDVLAWWSGEVDLGLAELEAVSCKIRATYRYDKIPAKKSVLINRIVGAGEGIRTLDPNLGKFQTPSIRQHLFLSRSPLSPYYKRSFLAVAHIQGILFLLFETRFRASPLLPRPPPGFSGKQNPEFIMYIIGIQGKWVKSQSA